MTVLDGTGPLPELLAAIDAAVGTPVLVRVPSDAEHLTQVLALCDRTLAVAGPRVRGLPAGAERVDPGVDPARLGRRLARASVGIAFGAGGAKGWAHVGVLRSLERAGYVVDAVAGSSIGAWIGAWTALGHDAAAVERLLREHFDDYAVHAIFRQGGPQGIAVMTRAARETTRDAQFADLDMPLSVLAADLAGQAARGAGRGAGRPGARHGDDGARSATSRSPRRPAPGRRRRADPGPDVCADRGRTSRSRSTCSAA